MKKILFLLLLPFMLLSTAAPKGKTPMKLGQLSQIAATTTDLKASITFWKKLGFRVVMQADSPAPWVQMTDETILVYIVQSAPAFIRLSYFTNDYEGTLKALKKAKVTILSQDNDAEGKPWRSVFKSPDGQEVSIVNRNPAMMFHPTGKTMMTIPQEDMSKPEKMPTKLGMLGEYCHKVTDLKASMAFWEKLGFESKGMNTEPYPWTVMTDGMTILGLHQTTDWDGSSITYFAPDMGKRIEGLKAEGIEVKEMGMGSSNVLVTSPEGVELFLFSL